MDTRRLIWAMALSFAVLYGWMFLQQKLNPQAPQTQPAAQTTTTQPASPASARAGTTEPASLAEASQPLWHAEGASAVQTYEIGQDDPMGTYDIQASLTNRGAGVERVLMVEKSGKKTKEGQPKYEYAATVEGTRPYPVIEPLVRPDGQKEYSWQTAGVRIGSPEATVRLADVPWHGEVTRNENGYQARFWVDIHKGSEPVVRIVKHYTLAPGSFAIGMDLRFEPLGGQDVSLVVEQLSAVGIRSEDPRSDMRKAFVVANNGGKAATTVYQHSSLAGKPPVEIGTAVPFWWTAMVDKYFAAITAPTQATGADKPVGGVKVFTYTHDPKAEGFGGDVAVELVSPAVTTTAAAPSEIRYDLYVGPKDPQIFTSNPTYAARQYDVMRSAEYAWCTFSALGDLLTSFLHWLYYYIPPHNYGVAIIILVLIVRVLLHPLTKHQQIAMAQMQSRQAQVQPKVAALKQKFGNDKQKLQMEMMKVYREAGINPASQISGCLPMLIQLPIWVALYSALNNDINLWHEPFALWIKDLSAPDALYSWAPAINIPLLSWMIGPVDKFNLLPILLSISMWLQQKYTPKPAPAPGTPQEQIDQQQQMQKMMGFMMIFFGVMFYNMPSGLNLYIMASTFFGVLESQRIRKHIEQRKALGEAAVPAKRNPWMEKIMDKIEKKATETRTIRKDKQQQ